MIAVPGAPGPPRLVDAAGAGKERHAGLVDGEGQHLRIVPEERLRAVAVVDVEVDVEHAVAGVARTGHAERDVVVDAEARRARGHRVVQAAAGMEGVVDLTGQDAVDGVDRAAGHRSPTPRASRRTAGSRPARCPSPAAATDRARSAAPCRCSPGVCSRRSSSSVASRGSTKLSAPTVRIRSIDGPNRRGVSGCSRRSRSQARVAVDDQRPAHPRRVGVLLGSPSPSRRRVAPRVRRRHARSRAAAA